MLKTVLPIKRGTKGPPLLKEWQRASLEELEEVLARHYHNCNYGLRLDYYLTLDPDDQKAADYLDSLEKAGLLPPTPTWTTWRGMKIRLYRRPEGEVPFNIKDDRMDLQIRMGSGQYCLIPNSQVKDGTYAWMPGLSPADLDIAVLPAATLEMLKQLKRYRTMKEKVIMENTDHYHAPTDPGEQIQRIMERCAFLQSDEWVFPNPLTEDRYQQRPKLMRGICKRAGVPYYGFHSIRHYVANLMADKLKVSTKRISRLLRHTNVRTTEIYLGKEIDDLRETFELLDKNLFLTKTSHETSHIAD